MTTSTPSADSTTQNALREAFDALLELPPEQRADWLDAHVADADLRERLRRLLAAHGGYGFLDIAAGEHAARLAARELAPEGLIGSRIGAFRLVRELGQGGMSAVFLGHREDADFRQQAAIKLLRRGLYSELEQRLFQRERRVLAALEHPNIARLIDGGVTPAGIPYLVMEFVDGLPITRFADARNLDARARVRLFGVVCRAVAEAHRNLIVHRDIKPSNILVAADGTVKLLDFGIAKLIEEDATGATGTIGVFTPDYAAPEQLRGGAITTATDVYGLGVLLHELLLRLKPGGTPTRRPSSRVNEIDGDAVPRIERARLRKLLRGDLDNILLKALAEEPQRRYASAGALADDIDNYLSGCAVVAHPPSRVYRARKFVQRHRGGVAITALFLAAILAALGLALWQAQVARREAVRADTVRDFVIGLFDAAKADLPRNERPTPEILVHEALKRTQADTTMDAGLRADLLLTLGSVSASLGEYPQAESLANAVAGSAASSDDTRLAAIVLKAEVEQLTNRNATADAELAAALPDLRRSGTRTAVDGLMLYATTQLYAGHADSSITLARETAAKAARLWPADSLDAIKVATFPGQVAISLRRDREGLSLLEPVIARWKALKLPQDSDYAQALMLLADAREHTGDIAGADAAHVENIALLRRIYDKPHDRLAVALDDYASFLTKRERYDDARKMLAEALAINRQVLGDQSLETADVLDSLGILEGARRDFPASERYLRQALAIYDAQVEKGGHEKDRALTRNHLALTLTELGKLDEAQSLSDLALKSFRSQFGENNDLVCGALYVSARIALKRGDANAALAASAHALDVLSHKDAANQRMVILNRQAHALALQALSRPDEALADVADAIATLQKTTPDAHARLAGLLALQARLQRELHRDADAAASVGQARALRVPMQWLAPEDAATLGAAAN